MGGMVSVVHGKQYAFQNRFCQSKLIVGVCYITDGYSSADMYRTLQNVHGVGMTSLALQHAGGASVATLRALKSHRRAPS
jgi:shikimate 5-dehydrogenase